MAGETVGIVGGTGPAGRALAARLAACGFEVRLGSRSEERGEEAAAALGEKWPGRLGKLAGCVNAEACDADITVVATPWDGAAATVGELSARLRGRTVVSMANALQRVGDEVQALMPPRGSVAVAVQQAAPEALVTGALHHVPARSLGNIDEELDADVLVCSDHGGATQATIELIEAIPGLRGVDAGSLSAAAAVEAFTAVLIGINIRHRAHASIRLTGFSPRAR